MDIEDQKVLLKIKPIQIEISNLKDATTLQLFEVPPPIFGYTREVLQYFGRFLRNI